MAGTKRLIAGQLLSFLDDPGVVGDSQSYRFHSDGILAVDQTGTIIWTGDRVDLPPSYNDWPIDAYPDCLILPGFIDAHLHFPQYRMLAAYGKDLLDWLNRYTFIEEQLYSSSDYSARAAKFFLDELLRHGITSALAFSTIHPAALDALFSEATARNMAMISGKTLMDRNAPDGLCDTPQSAYDLSKALIEAWDGRGRLNYAITPRFAVTSTEAQLEVCQALVREHPDLWMQTHLSENDREIESVARDFPWSKDYTDVYDHYGLLGSKSFFAHGIHLSERELHRLSESGSTLVHCPTSNTFLGSGLFRYHHARDPARPVSVGIGCDIGGGTHYSTLATLGEAYKVSQLADSRLSAFDAFYLATLGNARALKLDDQIGALEAGKMADVVVLDPQATPLMTQRHALSNDLHDVLFALMIMGDDRSIRATYVAGRSCKPQDY